MKKVTETGLGEGSGFFFFPLPRGFQDFISPTRDRTHALGSESMES